MVNRITNKVEVKKSRLFVPTGIIAVVFLTIGGLYMIVANIVGMSGFGGADSKTEAIKFVLFAITGLVACVPTFIDVFKNLSKKQPKTTNNEDMIKLASSKPMLRSKNK